MSDSTWPDNMKLKRVSQSGNSRDAEETQFDEAKSKEYVHAAKDGDLKKFKRLHIDPATDRNYLVNKRSAFMWAVLNGKDDVIRFLLRQKNAQ